VNRKNSRSLRQSQALFPFGTGAVLNYEGQSFVACDITKWLKGDQFHEPRLENLLGVQALKAPPRADTNRSHIGVPFTRFPQWLFCPKCRKMHHYRIREETGERPICKRCKSGLTPMRFVIACENGHLDDVPWAYWAHRGSSKRCEEQENLEFKVKPNGDGSLGSLYVECQTCESKNDLSQIMRFKNFRCFGIHPWRRRSEREDCEQTPRVLQRGASNLRYDYSVEAISIPPWTDFNFWGDDEQQIRQHSDFQTLVDSISNIPLFELLADKIAGELEVDVTLVEATARGNEEDENSRAQSSLMNIEAEEYVALKAPDKEHHPKDRFQKVNADISSFIEEGNFNSDLSRIYKRLEHYISFVSIINRLRCVRVLTGFSRIERSVEKKISVDIGKGNLNWLPGIEVFGEGVFVEINQEMINRWEKNTEVTKKVQILQNRFRNLPEGFQQSYPGGENFIPTAKFLLLHTLSHLLMTRMQFSAGYSTSSIRERIYCDFPETEEGEMSGFLLFTSAGDVEGSMGGLARLGKPELLFPLFTEALNDGRGCSRDPVCIESPGQGLDGLNLAACHSCALVPETSCQFRNQFLDRSLLVGTPDSQETGFFHPLIGLLEEL
jgi:hypothetical protein